MNLLLRVGGGSMHASPFPPRTPKEWQWMNRGINLKVQGGLKRPTGHRKWLICLRGNNWYLQSWKLSQQKVSNVLQSSRKSWRG